MKYFLKKLQLILSLLLAGIVLLVGIREGPALKETLVQSDFKWVVGGLGCYIFNYLLRAARFRAISKNKIRLWPDSIYAASLHGLATYMLPVRAGELALPVLLRSVSDLSYMEGGRILFKARVLDIVTLGFWMFWAALLWDADLPLSIRAGWGILGLCMCLFPKLIIGMRFLAMRFTPELMKRIESIISVSINFRELLLSLGIWAAVASCFYCTARALSIALNITDIWFLISIQLPMQIIPLQGIANAGNHEGGWVAGLMILGFSAPESLKFALASHTLIIFYVLVLGPMALLIRNWINIKEVS